MNKYLKYLSYILRHKWFVFVEACKLGIPIRGVLHDLSKFRPCEFLPYVEHFYGDKNPRNADGSYNPLDIEDSFDRAWLSHQHRNSHHWQYWILRRDGGAIKVLDMPMRYRKEMLADWRGAGRAQGNSDTVGWYLNNAHKMELHPNTRQWIEGQLGIGDNGD
jgi:hypothetical protein